MAPLCDPREERWVKTREIEERELVRIAELVGGLVREIDRSAPPHLRGSTHSLRLDLEAQVVALGGRPKAAFLDARTSYRGFGS